jgi:hypothetical protein
MRCYCIDQRLVLIDPVTIHSHTEDVPIDGPITFVVSQDSKTVVVASNIGKQGIVLYDVASMKQTFLAGPLGLNEFASRPGHDALWLLYDKTLHALDLKSGTLEPVTLPFTPSHLNMLPKHDALILSEEPSRSRDTGRLDWLGLRDKKILRAIDLQPR